MRKADGKAVIIKKEEIVEGEGHGGAWKVAYADFVTAMMAFFLLMWLINATTEDQRKGLADYFSPNNLMSQASSGTGQPFGGHTAFDSGAMVSDRGAVQVLVGNNPTSTERSDAISHPAPPRTPSRHGTGKRKDGGLVGNTGAQSGSNQDTGFSQSRRGRAADREAARTNAGRHPANGAARESGAAEAGTPAPGTGGTAALSQAGAGAPPSPGVASNPAVGASANAATGASGNAATGAERGAVGGADDGLSAAAAAAALRTPTEAERRADAAAEEAVAFASTGKAIIQAVRDDPTLASLAGQLRIDVTQEGLRIQILDRKHSSMFALGSAAPNDRVQMLLQKLTPMLLKLPEQISIAGYTDATPFPGPGRTNWELSAARANAARRLLMDDGLPDNRVQSVTGHADRDLLVPAHPFAAANRRIAIVVLRGSAASVPAPPAAAPAR